MAPPRALSAPDLLLCQALILGCQLLRQMVAEGRKPSGPLAFAAQPDGLHRTATIPELSFDIALATRRGGESAVLERLTGVKLPEVGVVCCS